MGFNFNATFAGLENLPVPHLPRLTPDGVAYNYDNGYVLPDSSGGQGGQTWNWGYDSSAAQISGNNILISRNTGTAPSARIEMEDDPSWGGELVYELLIPYERGTCFGLQLAGNFQSLSLSDDSAASTGVRRLTYPFAYTPGTKPPTATVGNPYQGTFDGPGFTISDTPGTPLATVLPDAATVSGHRKWRATFGACGLAPFSRSRWVTDWTLRSTAASRWGISMPRRRGGRRSPWAACRRSRSQGRGATPRRCSAFTAVRRCITSLRRTGACRRSLLPEPGELRRNVQRPKGGAGFQRQHLRHLRRRLYVLSRWQRVGRSACPPKCPVRRQIPGAPRGPSPPKPLARTPPR